MKSFCVLALTSLATLIFAAPVTENAISAYYIGENQPDGIKFGDCFPFKNDGSAIDHLSLTAKATCSWYVDDECEGTGSAPFTLNAGNVPGARLSVINGAFVCSAAA